MLKHLHGSALRNLADYDSNRYFVALPPGITFEDILEPTFWAHHQRRLKLNDQVTVMQVHDEPFDIDLRVVAVPTGGVIMKVRPHFGGKAGVEALAAAEAVSEARAKKVPFGKDGRPAVRIEHLPATGWRVRGLNNEEVARNLPSEAKANEVMAKYLADAQLTMPSEEECKAALAAAEAAAAARVATAAKKPTKAA